MIIFDLDGVFLSDANFSYAKDEEQFKDMRLNFIYPIWKPTFEYVVITGRPKRDYKHTMDWFNLHSFPLPSLLFHDNPDEKKPLDYKVSVLNSLRYKHSILFIESDKKQAEEIRKLIPYIRVVHFEELIQKAVGSYIEG